MAPTPDAGTLVAGRYRLVRRLEEDATTVLWEGHDEVLARPVTVKVLRAELAADPDLRERFHRSAVAAARIVHPGIVATYDAGTDAETTWVVGELAGGRRLADEVPPGATMAPGDVAALGAALADALACAHAAGVGHHDLRASTVLLCADDPREPGAVKLVDVGLSLDRVDPADDVRALGALLYRLLCGRDPAGDPPVPPRRLRADVPADLDAAVVRALGTGGPVPSAAELRGELLADAEPPPPTSGRATAETQDEPTFRESERSWLVPAALIAAAAVVLVALSVAFSRSEVGRELLGRPPAPDAEERREFVAVGEVGVLDPADGKEKNELLPLIVDLDPATRWRTASYSTRNFGNLKPGLGVALRLVEPAELAALVVASPTSGWSATVHVADAPAPDLAGWGPPVATVDDVRGDATIDLGGRRGGAVLLWITRLGTDRRMEIGGIGIARR